MKLLEQISENEFVATFLLGELSSKRFGQEIREAAKRMNVSIELIQRPDVNDESQNQQRKKLLAEYRGYGGRELFENFPADVVWYKAALGKDEVLEVKYINYSYWNDLSDNTRSPVTAAKNIERGYRVYHVENTNFLEAAEVLKQGKTFPPLILVAQNPSAELVVLEGHVRLTAFALVPECIPDPLEAIVGISQNIMDWPEYSMMPPHAHDDSVRVNEIVNTVHSLVPKHRQKIIAIDGGGGAGKSTLAKNIQRLLPGAHGYRCRKQFSLKAVSMLQPMRPKLIILNGTSGVGKSTVALTLCQELPAYHLDIDEIRRRVPGYPKKREETARIAYEQAEAIIKERLQAGESVLVDKAILSADNTLKAFTTAAQESGAEVYEFLLYADKQTIQTRADMRGYHAGGLLTQTRVGELWEEAEALRSRRPDAIAIDTAGMSIEEVLQKVRGVLWGDYTHSAVEKKIEKSWFEVDGHLEPIAYDGDSYFRFPREVAERVLATYSKQGDWVLDPFAGFGTTLHAAQAMGRNAIGIEIDVKRAEFANRGLNAPNRVLNARAENITDLGSEHSFNLVFTSPPYVTVRLEDDPWGATYFQDMEKIFTDIKPLLTSDARVVIEVSNIRTQDGLRPLAWQFGEMLSKIYTFQGEVIRCNTSEVDAGPGFNHSYLLVFKQ